jgi:hypothetical protein
MWQKETADVNGNGKLDTEWPPDRVQWQDALKYCEGLSFAEHDDWRLPNIRELHSIVDYALWEPAMDSVFQAVLSDYWSSSSWVLSAGYAWVLILHGGGLSYSVHDKVHFYYVRAVRTVLPGE